MNDKPEHKMPPLKDDLKQFLKDCGWLLIVGMPLIITSIIWFPIWMFGMMFYWIPKSERQRDENIRKEIEEITKRHLAEEQKERANQATHS
ncbi:MAG: hypothetical protein ACR2NQ_05715 [Thermodesulfobacteriota bacterium]